MWEGTMRAGRIGAALLAASLSALCGSPLYAGEPGQRATNPAPAPEPASTAPDEASKTVLPYHDVQGVLGKEVRSSAGEDMGRIVDVLVDQTGQIRAAVVDFGGFLGVGNRKVVVDWNALHFAPSDQPDRITLDLTRSQVKEAPEYKPGKPVVVLGALGPAARPDL
jgi:sporulation protein YlmC with PRC-barrel domain